MSSAPYPTTPPDGRRTGATWVAATGAFLLLAAATVFVAVRWDELPEGAKIALVGALTGGFLVGGRALRRSLPATGDVLFHLGALLIPIDVAALSLRLDLGWRPLLLVEGLVGVGALGALAAAAGSVVLTGAAAASVIVLAAGIAAVSPLPAPLLLAGAAVTAHLLRRHGCAVGWAAVAGLAPALGAVATAGPWIGEESGDGFLGILHRAGPEVLEELGLAGGPAALVAVLTGAVTATVLGREAARRRDLGLVALAGACLTTGAATTWVNASPSREAAFVAVGALFVLVQAAALLCRRDAFWRRPARAVALTAEVVAGVLATPFALGLLLVAPFVEDGVDVFSDSQGWRPEPAAGVAWALLAGGWLLASWRRLADAEGPAPSPLVALRAAVADDRIVVLLAAAAGAGVVVGTASTIAIAAGLVVLAAGLAASRGVVATLVAAAAAAWAPLLLGPSHPLAALPVGLAAAAVLGVAAVAWQGGGWAATGLATTGSILAFCSCAIAGEAIGLATAMAVAVLAAWATALLVERACPPAGHVARATMLVGLAGAMTGTVTDALAVAALVTLLFALDAVRRNEPLVALGSSLAVQVVVGGTGLASGLDLSTIGLVLCAGGAVLAGLSAAYPARWRVPFMAAAAAGMLGGLPLASLDGARFAEALVLAGAVTVGAGVVLRSWLVAHGGAALAVAGIGLHLAVDGVTALEPFVAPVALQLLVAGWQLRRTPGPSAAGVGGSRPDLLSSWVAYGPGIALMGGAALAERLSGGEAWHGLVGGAVGVAAVAAGGWRRLAGPLFLGTGLIAAVTVLESLATLAGVPTWAWLAAGGFSLLGAGVALERSATSPLEAGRRLVDVVDERFS